MSEPTIGQEQARLWKRIVRQVGKIYPPPLDLNLVEWADNYRHVAGGATPGPWSTMAQPMALGPMRAATDSETHTVVMMVGTQTIKTETLLCLSFYHIAVDPCEQLVLAPDDRNGDQSLQGLFGSRRIKQASEA